MWDPKETLKSVGLGPKSEQKRSVRVAEAIRNELSMLLLTKVCDPKLAEVGISRVELADDLKYARIYFTVLGDKTQQLSAKEGLQRAKGFMRSHLAKVINMRYTPELQFVYDQQIEKVVAMEKLLQEIANERGGDDESGS
ncbi:MAG: 30S ribosome-binding factor RbfA [Proteobacteria bacterium]|nr:30S ribosome-binding factor RbfA [Desulfocapsa sp.]MBU3943430.1 30S ribosome-binding factor RbfA [Pseudomonadota bacterium]MCG2743926.1 30S ribosome-binding factor RbfA [Desulfobacteraceae bacterium]MBU3984061.1 30S ribosome-binding factor RbfA [Pseudomonadota bacterium]MBU4030436.1 30S ribosome-binding factor RbfA [Pseudomonadota bacterium]